MCVCVCVCVWCVFVLVCVSPACDDECSGPLLDDLDLLDQHFLSLNLSAVNAASYRHLLLLEARSRELQVPGHCPCWSGVTLPPATQESLYQVRRSLLPGVCVQEAWSGNGSVAVGVVNVEEELSRLTFDLDAALQQVRIVVNLKSSHTRT